MTELHTDTGARRHGSPTRDVSDSLSSRESGVHARRAWTALALGVGAQASATVFLSAPAFLIPLLHSERGMSLAQAGTLAAVPTIGMVLTLIAWGALTDRIGERWVIAGGLALTALAGLGAMTAHGYVPLGAFLLLGGMAAASTNAASGRVVVGWFPKSRRGMAMGIRQMCQPLGVTVAALTIPTLASAAGPAAALAVPFALTAVFAVAGAVGIRNPPRRAPRAHPAEADSDDGAPTQTTAPATTRTVANPYRRDGFLWRVHGVSMLLVVPQFTLSTFGLVWLVSELHWSALAAGALMGISQFVGAFGRLGVGMLSDAVASRVRPLRWVALLACAAMLALAALDQVGWAAAAVFLVATTASVADNGLAYTSVAEAAGTEWAGRALGTQNTGQYIAASAVGPVVGALIGVVGYPLAFVAVALCPAVAAPLIPHPHAERDHL